jgi:hypothetical protein
MKKFFLVAALFAITGLLVFQGCSKDSSAPQPVTSVSLGPNQVNVELGHSTQITPTVNGHNKELRWYVSGVENGNELVGQISQNSPVTYTAPNWLPDPPAVEVRAVSVEDTTAYDSCMVTLTFNKLFVDAENGNDADNGCINLPFKTITHAMDEADTGIIVVVMPGVYDHDNGEEFPIGLSGLNITLVGMDWETCIIRGHGETGYQPSVNVGGQGCKFRKFTVEPGLPEEPASSVVVHVSGDDCLIDSLRTAYRGAFSVLRLDESENATIQNNYFVVDDGETWDRGYEIVFNNSGTVIRNCTVSGYFTGFFFNTDQDALVEGCVIEGNQIGVDLCCHESETSNPSPDFGGGARGSAGGNSIRNNTQYGLMNETYNVIFAKYNIWNNDPPVAGEDYHNTSSGGVVVE